MLIAEKRKRMRLTQEELAAQLNVDRSTVAKWETGKSAPRSFMLIRLAKILKCPLEELFDETQGEEVSDGED